MFAATTLTLLAVPGPTNTLLAASGAAAGFRRSLPLVLAEIGGYAISVSVLTAVSVPITAALPFLPVVFRIALVLYLVWLAWRLWTRQPVAETDGRPITFSQVFITTLLNPKAAIFAFAIFPAAGERAGLPALAIVFVFLVLCMGTSWTALGASLGRLSTSIVHIRRASASVLLVFACLIATTIVTNAT
jgi:threonine/homoserine/homoserine lactone efflux protein